MASSTSPSSYKGKGLNIGYSPPLHYFNTPKYDWNGTAIVNKSSYINSWDESFEFRALNCMDHDEMSSAVSQNVVVININDPTTITFTPTQQLEVYATSNIKSDKYPTELKIEGIGVLDVDLGVDIIRADIITSEGMYISSPHLMDYVSRYSRMSTNVTRLFTGY
jgi:hypothetical protein